MAQVDLLSPVTYQTELNETILLDDVSRQSKY